jgi:hypothetical protein
VQAGQQSLVDLQQLQQLVRPDAVDHVEQQHAAGVADFGGVLAGHAEADVVFGQQDVLGFGVDFGLVLPDPEDFWRGEPGEGGVGHEVDQ